MCIILEAPSVYLVSVWHTTMGPGTHSLWMVWWHTIMIWCNRVVLQFLSTSGCTTWIKQAAIQEALNRSSGNVNWWWFGKTREDCNGAFGLLQKASVWGVFGKSVFSYVMQSENAILIAHFSWIRIWSSRLWAAAGLAIVIVISYTPPLKHDRNPIFCGVFGPSSIFNMILL